MNKNITTTNPKAKLCEDFNIKSDRLATEYVDFDETLDQFSYSNAVTWGKSVRVSVERKEHPATEILSLEGHDEEELINELADIYANVAYDKDEFKQAIQTKYEAENEI